MGLEKHSRSNWGWGGVGARLLRPPLNPLLTTVLTQPSSASSLGSPALLRPSRSSSLRRGAFFTLPRRSGVSGRPECQPDAFYSPFRRPAFSRPSPRIFTLELPELAPETSIFYARARSGAPHFSPCRGTYMYIVPTNIWGECPPPPPDRV